MSEKFDGLVMLEKGRVCAIIKGKEDVLIYDIDGLQWMVTERKKDGVWQEALDALREAIKE